MRIAKIFLPILALAFVCESPLQARPSKAKKKSKASQTTTAHHTGNKAKQNAKVSPANGAQSNNTQRKNQPAAVVARPVATPTPKPVWKTEYHQTGSHF